MREGVHDMGSNRLFNSIKVAIAVLVCAACLTGSGCASRTVESIELPGTAAGRCAAAYFDAFNSGSGDTVQTFQERYRARCLERPACLGGGPEPNGSAVFGPRE